MEIEQVAFIALRKGGQNFGKPVSAEMVMKEYVYDEIVEMFNNDSVRFYSEEGDALESKGALAYLENFVVAKDFMKCKTMEQYMKFIETYGSNIELGKVAILKIEELVFERAETEEDYEKFLMRFPNSSFADQARAKCNAQLKKRVLVISSLEMISINDNLMDALENQNYKSISTAVLTDSHVFEEHVMKNDTILVVMDDKHYVDILTLFAYCLEYRKEMILVFEDGTSFRKMTMEDVDKALIHLQTHSSSEHFNDVIRDIRLNVPDFIKKVSGLKRLKTSKMEMLSVCLN